MGQKTNPNIYRLGVNKEWKTEFFEKKKKEFAFFSYIDVEIQSYIERFLNTYGLLLHEYKVQYNNSIINIYISYYVTTTFKQKKPNQIKSIIDSKGNLIYVLKKINKNVSKTSKTENLELGKAPVKKYKIINFYPNPNTRIIETFIIKFIEGVTLLKSNQNNIIVNLHCINNNINLNYKQQQSLKKKLLLLQRFKNTDIFKESIEVLFLTVSRLNSAKLLSEFIKLQLKKIKRQKFLINFLKKTLTLFLNSNFSKVIGIKIKIKGRINGVPRAKHKTISIGNLGTQTINSKMDYSESTVHNSNGSYGIKVWIIGKNDQ